MDKVKVDFELGEDIHKDSQEKLWSNANIDGRSHVSNREFAIIHRNEAIQAIRQYYIIKELINIINNKYNKSKIIYITSYTLSLIIDYAFYNHGQLVHILYERSQMLMKEVIIKSNRNIYPTKELTLNQSNNFLIYVRKRPLMSYELTQGCYDVCSIDYQSVILHNCQLARNGRSLTIQHKHYFVDKVFNEDIDNNSFCEDAIEPLLSWALKGNESTFLCFGQTGTGKTYSLIGSLEYLSNRLLGYTIKIKFYEIHGKKCYDLLNNRQIIHIRSDENDVVHIRGANEILIQNLKFKQLLNLMKNALELRKFESTERNNYSSRSHAICCISIVGLPDDSNMCSSASSNDISLQKSCFGTITLVDLAGSERNYETLKMSASQHKESSDINLSLMALKNCFRLYLSTENNKGRIPFRSSLLTRILQRCFNNSINNKTCILATVSPSPIDVIHSINTLEHVLMMSTYLSKYNQSIQIEIPKHGCNYPLSSVPVNNWTHEQLIQWLGYADGSRFAHLVIPKGMTGEKLLEYDSQGLASMFANEMNHIARNEEEGLAWTIENDEIDKHKVIANALWSAIRREHNNALLQSYKVSSYSNNIY